MANNNNENNNTVELIESGFGRFGTAAIATAKSGLGFGLKHTGNGIAWLGNKMADAGVNLQVSAIKDKFAVGISSVLAQDNVSEDQIKEQVAELTKTATSKIDTIVLSIGDRIQKQATQKCEFLSGIDKVKTAINAACGTASNMAAEIVANKTVDNNGVSEVNEIVIETETEQPAAPKKTEPVKKSNPQPKQQKQQQPEIDYTMDAMLDT